MPKITKTNILLGIFFIITTLLALKDPQGFIFPISILVIIFRDSIGNKFASWSPSKAFVFTGIVLGLTTEVFAIISNLNLPPEKKILMHPDPIIDILIGIFYYGFVIFTWLFFIKRYSFSKKAVFSITALLGIVTEQSGAILYGIFANIIIGTLTALIIACIYGAFPTLAYMVTKKYFEKLPRKIPKYYHYFIAICAIFLQWAIFGLFINNTIVSIFPK